MADPHPHVILKYSIAVLSVLLLTVLSIKWNLAMFQVLLDTSPGEIQSVSVVQMAPQSPLRALREHVEPPVGIQPGTRAYFALDSVRGELVANAQAAREQLKRALESMHSLSSSQNIARAIVIYLPPGKPAFAKEVKAMYLSIAYMRTFQPDHIKTDLLVYTPSANFEFPRSIGCTTQVRTNFADPEACIVLPHTPLPERSNPAEPLNDYGWYIDSIMILAEFAFETTYAYVMRSDSDTFITAGFADWTLPDGKYIATGRGGYGSTNSERHLAHVAGVLGMTKPEIMNVGSTWYGRPTVLKAAALLTVSIMRWLDSQEFSEYEKKYAGVDGWPNWHWPVILLYGGHIAINQLPSSAVIVGDTTTGEMDARSEDSSVSPIPSKVKHIHCWHTDKFFSKFKFQNGSYRSMDLTSHKDMRTMSDYAGTIAISSDRLTPEEISKYVSNTEDMRNKAWVRTLPITATRPTSFRTNTNIQQKHM